MKPRIDLKNPSHQMLILTVLIGALAVILYLNFLLKPQIARVAAAVIEANKIRAELKAVESKIANIDRYKREISAYRDKVARYEHMLPAEQEIPTLLESLSGMARSSGVKILGITPVAMADEKKERGGMYQEIPILISANSGYHELGNFLAKLESSDRFMKCADLDIRANKASPKRHSVELLVLTYVLSKGK